MEGIFTQHGAWDTLSEWLGSACVDTVLKRRWFWFEDKDSGWEPFTWRLTGLGNHVSLGCSPTFHCGESHTGI